MSDPSAPLQFVLFSFGQAKRFWLERGYEENDIEELWRSAEKVLVRCKTLRYPDPARRIRVDEMGRSFEVLAKVYLPSPSEGQ